MRPSLLSLFLPLLTLNASTAFVAPSPSSRLVRCTNIPAKKSSTSGKGFGTKSAPTPKNDVEEIPVSLLEDDDTNKVSTKASPASSSLSPEDRTKSLLSTKYGLKSYEEQRAMEGDARLLAQSEAKSKRRDQLRNIEKLWPEDKDVFEVLPPSLLRGIDTALKTGLGICTVLFMVSGIFITIEAGSKATGKELPEGLDAWIVNVVEPNFTPLLGVLLGFSVSLGLFASGQLGSKGSVYREDP